MIRISYTSPAELEFSASPRELQAVHAELLALAHGSKTQFIFSAYPSTVATPYDRLLNALVARVTTGPTKVSVVADSLEVEGSKESFHGFASFFEFRDNVVSGTHTHHEYFEGNIYVHPDSVPIVISIQKQKSDG